MRSTLTLVLALTTLPLSAAGEVAESSAAQQAAQNSPDLLFLAADFQGAATAEALAMALKQGASLKMTDLKGNTPLILLASVVEKDSRSKSDAGFRKALHDTIILLMQNGADCLVENNAGCNALFFLHSDEELMKKLHQLKLIPRELSIRIPHEESAISRYMQLRLAQAGYSKNPASLEYLKRRYCKPAYPRVLDKLKTYLSAETSSHIPAGELQDTLEFLRMADEEAITDYINSLTLWEHGEHFLEEIPERMLVALCDLNWDVTPQNLQLALDKLETLLPVEEGDMIDCYAAYPMGRLLEMMQLKDAEKTQTLLTKYTQSHDPDMAYTAYRIILQQKELPLPEPGSLSEILNLANGIEAMPDEQKRIMECAIVDDAMRREELKNITPEMLLRVQGYYREMNLEPYAAILSDMIRDNRLITPEEGLYEVCSAYREAHTTSPRIVLARYILEHPELFVRETP
ncbi:MAG: hypothetical protein IKV82_03960 [Akkermansia sp.]|nr:hypothetical protein [Akkermansia sp.]